jgi:hypothetical protein
MSSLFKLSMEELSSNQFKRFLKFFQKGVFVLLLAAMFIGCRINAPEPPRSLVDSILTAPVSNLNVPIFYPIRELEQLLNERLENKIIEAPIAINQKGDSIFLTISKFKAVILKYDGDHSLTYQLPLLVTGSVHGKLLGVDMKNKTPVQAKLVVTLRSELGLSDSWQMKTKTSITNFKWAEEPIFKIAGIKIKLSSPVEKMLHKNEEKITLKIDQAISGMMKVEKTIERIWMNLQKPILINKKAKPVWLKSEHISMSEQFLGHSKDTLTIGVKLKTKLQTLLDTANLSKSLIPLGKQDSKTKTPDGLNAYLLATIPFKDINKMIEQVTDTMRFKFEGHQVRIKNSEMYGTNDGIAIRLDLAGDVKARLYLRGKPAYDTTNKSLSLTDFGFDVNSEESLVNAADWFAHDDLISRIQPHLSLSVGKSIEALPSLIFKGIEKGKLGEKIDLNFSKFDAGLYQYLITKDNIQVIIHVTGQANLQLQKGLFVKKKKQ